MIGPFLRARRAETVAAVLLFTFGALLIGLGSFERFVPNVPMWLRFVPLAMVCLGVVVRRTNPAWVIGLGSAGFVMEIGIGLTLATACVYTENLYAFARYGPRRGPRVLLPIFGVAIAAFVVWAAYDDAPAVAIVSTAALGAIVLVSPVGTGIIVRQAHDRATLESERAEQIARLSDVRNREAVLRERTSMARELHDSVANYLSAIALQSTGLQARKDVDPDTLARSVAAIRQSSVDGLAELRRIIGLLRTSDTGEDLASYRIDQVPALAEQMRRVGLAVALDVGGAERELPGEVQTAAYRVVQEALTNALKYGSDAEVRLVYEPACLVVTVDNVIGGVDGAGGAAPTLGGGAGLIGMTERVRLLGGTVEAGAGPDGRWCVRAHLPTDTAEKGAE